MIKELKPRLYQQTILASCINHNSLVVLPTGMGKSIIFVLMAAQRLTSFPKSKILILAPTKPLCEQHVKTLKQFLDLEEDEIILLTGTIKPEQRKILFEKAKVIVSTPQGMENDIISNRISFDNVSLLVFDECHRAVKDYSYTWLAKHYMENAQFPRILGLTASPGSDLEVIEEVIDNLSVENIEIRTEDDPDVKPYIQDVELNYDYVSLDDKFKKIREYIIAFIDDKASKLNELVKTNFVKASNTSKIELIKLQASLMKGLREGEKDFTVMKAVSVLAEIMKMHYALELLETQGLIALKAYFDKMFKDSLTTKTKAVKNLVQDLNYRSARILTDSLVEEGHKHPKLERLKEIVDMKMDNNEKIIVFNNFRDNAANLVDELNTLGRVKAELFVGQSKKNGTGLTQKKQIEILEKFRNDEFNVIVMTSVGEEGIDIPKVDSVIFYEPVSSAIRHIQRKGRTGRLDDGEVLVLVTKGTRDEIYRWSSFRKERKMYDILKTLKDKIALKEKPQPQKSLNDFSGNEEIIIYADHREKSSRMLKELMNHKVNLKLEQLDVADYVLSDDVGVEFKTTQDFVDSLIDGRLLGQIKDLKYNYKKPLLIIEGIEDLYSIRNIHPNAIRGMLATITITFGIPILYTKTTKETVQMLLTIAKKEQLNEKKYFSPNATKRGISLKDKQLFFVSSLPDIGTKLADSLLEKFKSPKNIINASIDDLKEVEKIGKEKASKLKEVFDTEF